MKAERVEIELYLYEFEALKKNRIISDMCGRYLKSAEKIGICIPNDLAVVGYGSLNSGKLITPQLTTYSIPIKEMCYATVDLLVKLITNVPVAEKIIQFNGEMVIRDSV